MATLWIREYDRLGYAGEMAKQVAAGLGAAPIPQEPGIDQSPLTFSTSAASAAFGTETTVIRVYGSAAFHYVVGTTPVATTSHMKWPADVPLEVGVAPGQKIAVIAAA